MKNNINTNEIVEFEYLSDFYQMINIFNGINRKDKYIVIYNVNDAFYRSVGSLYPDYEKLNETVVFYNKKL